MATAPSLDELLICPICQDDFENPMVLKCHHTLCSNCLTELKRVSGLWWKVDCPICRQTTRTGEIQRDFRTVTLLEARNQQNQRTELKSIDNDQTSQKRPIDTEVPMKLCELCNKDPVRNRCKQCNRIICATCSDTHKSIPACKNHTIHSLDSLVGQHKGKLSQAGDSLRELEGKVAAKCQQLQLYQHSMDELENQTLDVIAHWFEDMISSIARHKDTMNEKVSKAIATDKADMQKVQNMVSELQTNIRDNKIKINTMLEENDPAKVLAATDDLLKTVKSSSQKVENTKFTTPKLLDMNIVPGKKWDPSTGITVQISKTNSTRQIVPWTPFPSDFDTKHYTQTLEVVVENDSKQILFHAGYIWLLYHNRIDIHNKEGTWIDSVSDHIDNPNGLAPMSSGNLLVACMGSGLVQINSGGRFLCTIAEGCFCDTSADTQFVYGLDYTDSIPSIKLYQKGLFKWGLVREFKLPYDNCNPCNTLLSNGLHIFTGVATNSCIYRYHSSGTILEKYEWPGPPGRREHRPPRLCCADTNGQVLVAHFLQNSIWILSKDNVWKEFQVDGLVNPYAAAFDNEGGLWIVNLTNQLVRYT